MLMGSKIKDTCIYDVISNNIKKYRIEANMTQEDLAEKANYTHQFIRRIEAPHVKKTFSLETIYFLSKALNRNFSDMFDGLDEIDRKKFFKDNQDEKEVKKK